MDDKKLNLYTQIFETPLYELEEILEFIHPADVLDLINDESIEFDRTVFLNRLPDWFLTELMNEEEEEDKVELLNQIAQSKHKTIIEEMASDELADMIGAMDLDQRHEIIANLDDEDQQEITKLLGYDPSTAGGIMQTEFINIYDNKTVGKVLKYLREIKDDVENAYTLFVVDRENHVKGSLTLEALVTSELDEHVMDIMNPNIISVNYKMDQEEIVLEFEKYNLALMPVVDDDNKILGVITFDDVIEVMKEEATEDILQLGGVHAEETVDSSVTDTIKSRLPWLVINLFTAFIASSVITFFSDTISQVVAVAAIMPIISGIGGNTGTQTLTLITRSIALGELDDKNLWSSWLKELGAAIFNGIVLASLTGFLSYFINQNFTLGILVGIAMILNTLVAVVAGFFIPYFFNKLKIDPAISSGVFVTACTDISGFLLILGLTSLFIERII